MTYLQLVNGVLSRLREDTVTTLAGQDDVVVNIVKDLVNDAKQICEDAHTWNALLKEWSVTTAAGTSRYSLIDSSNSPTLQSAYASDGTELTNVSIAYIRKKAAANNNQAAPYYYAVDGVDANRDVRITLYPTPDAVDTLTVYGFNKQDELSADTDVLLIPSKPVLYTALALAARERGEVGGQTSMEIFMMADRYLSDAIAYDASLNDLDNIWVGV